MFTEIFLKNKDKNNPDSYNSLFSIKRSKKTPLKPTWNLWKKISNKYNQIYIQVI